MGNCFGVGDRRDEKRQRLISSDGATSHRSSIGSFSQSNNTLIHRLSQRSMGSRGRHGSVESLGRRGSQLQEVKELVQKQFTVVVMGPSQVGKTDLIYSFMGRILNEYEATIEDRYEKDHRAGHHSLTLEVVDTGGKDQYKALQQTWMESGHAFIVMFSLESQASFEEAKDTLAKIAAFSREHPYSNLMQSGTRGPIVFVGNRRERSLADRDVSKAEAERVAELYECDYVETCANLHHNVNDAFDKVSRGLVQLYSEKGPSSDTSLLHDFGRSDSRPASRHGSMEWSQPP